MKPKFLYFISLLVLLPLLWELPYIFKAIGESPLESYNYVFLALAVGQCAFSFIKCNKDNTLKRLEKLNLIGVFLILLSLMCLAASWHKHIHFALILSSVALIWSVSFTLCNWPAACALLPICAMFMLGIPSTGFLLGNATGLNGLTAKSILATVFLLMTLLATSKYRPSPKTLIYACACLAIAACYCVNMTPGSLAAPLSPNFNALSADGFSGTNMEISDADRNFFGTGDIQRFFFSDNNGNAIQVLDVANVANIHAVHPMTYCLRASGYILENEQTIAITIDGREVFVQEITAIHGGKRTLHWQWYSTPEHSTASFLLFRSVYSPKENWRIIQLCATMNDTPENARASLLHFTNAFVMQR